MILAHHLILTAYGHWLPNDPRGSMSERTHTPRIRELGPAHYGRKSAQPGRGKLRGFYRKAERRLAYPTLWFDSAERRAVVEAVGEVV